MESMFLIFGWPGPIGVGVFLLCLGVFIYFLAKAGAIEKPKKKE